MMTLTRAITREIRERRIKNSSTRRGQEPLLRGGGRGRSMAGQGEKRGKHRLTICSGERKKEKDS